MRILLQALATLALLILASPATPAAELAADAESSLRAHLQLAVSVDASGRVTAVDTGDLPIPDALREPLLRDMHGWEFEPALVDGQPAPSLTHVSLTLQAERIDVASDAWAVRITHASNGPRTLSRDMPRIPVELLRKGQLRVRFLVTADIDAQGTVQSVAVESTESNIEGRNAGRDLAKLEKAWTHSFARWTFQPEQVDGKPIAARITLPMSFCVERVRSRGAKGSCADGGDSPSPAIPDGIALAEQPAARLRTEVVGRVL